MVILLYVLKKVRVVGVHLIVEALETAGEHLDIERPYIPLPLFKPRFHPAAGVQHTEVGFL